ncbi:MAG TPA: hypothetical protein VNM24_15440 [Burkholderiales bacterium]|nr:hypothetical protein [Burkholderiales bacterium]
MGLLPITAPSVASGVIGFMKAALGLRFAPDFFLAAFFAVFFAGAFLAGFLVFFGAFFAAFFAGFFAFFLAVAIFKSPMKGRDIWLVVLSCYACGAENAQHIERCQPLCRGKIDALRLRAGTMSTTES